MNGGDWNNGANAGLGALNLNNPASNANWNIGARPANEKLARRGAAKAAPTVPFPSASPSFPHG